MKTDPRKNIYLIGPSAVRMFQAGASLFVFLFVVRTRKNECANILSLKTALPKRVNSLIAF